MCVCVDCWKNCFFFLLRKIQHLPGWNMPTQTVWWYCTVLMKWKKIFLFFDNLFLLLWQPENELAQTRQRTMLWGAKNERERKKMNWNENEKQKTNSHTRTHTHTLGGKAIEWMNEWKTFFHNSHHQNSKTFFFTPQNFYDLWICVDGNRIFRRIFFLCVMCTSLVWIMNSFFWWWWWWWSP